jgi:hypothetical protein
MVIGFLHFGQGPVWPANLSLTVKVDRQPGQMTWMAMDSILGENGGVWGDPALPDRSHQTRGSVRA